MRLVLEESGVEYVDLARMPEEEGGGVKAIQKILGAESGMSPIFAVPVIEVDGWMISQTANICLFLARRLGLVPSSDEDQLVANQLQLTFADFVDEIHDTHHPIAVAEYYEDQKEEARRKSKFFLDIRLPKFMGFFEDALRHNGGAYFVGDELSYVDLSAYQVVRGLEYAFPQATEEYQGQMPSLMALAKRVEERPRIAEYLKSERRISFNENGIFRHYPELDRGAQ